MIFLPWKIFLEAEKGEPLFETSRHVLWQAVVDVQLGDLHLEPLPVSRVLDPDGCEVFRGHPGDGGHVIAGCPEEVEVLLVVEVGEPGSENLLVRDARLKHLLDVQGLDVVCVQAWLDRSSSCDQVAIIFLLTIISSSAPVEDDPRPESIEVVEFLQPVLEDA